MIQFLFGLPFSYRQRRLAVSRSPVSREQFVDMIATDRSDRLVAENIWDALLASRVFAAFVPHPDDSFRHVYGIAEEELDQDLIACLFNELGLALPDRDFTKQFGPIDSPRQVIQFVREWRRRTRRW